MKRTSALLILVGVIFLCGCGSEQRVVDDGRLFLNVDFVKGEQLRYEYVSERELELNWQPEKGTHGKIDKTKETFRMVLNYLPTEVDKFGLSTVVVSCESIRAESRPQRGGYVDAAMKLKGRSFTIKVSPTGEIVETQGFANVVQELGAMAFRSGDQANIKEPDMINDIIAAEWFMWDAISSIATPVDGVVVGDSWNSRLSVPGPMLVRLGRDVTYTLAEVRDTNDAGQIAVINSVYSAADEGVKEVPWPYMGKKSFQMAGKFGFLGGYKMLEMKGEGEVLFNIDRGVLLSNEQRYTVTLETSPPFGLNVKPILTVKQKMTTKLL